jgi:hypothetical protein
MGNKERRSLELTRAQWFWLEYESGATHALATRGPNAGNPSWRVFISDMINERMREGEVVTVRIDRVGTEEFLADPDTYDEPDNEMNSRQPRSRRGCPRIIQYRSRPNGQRLVMVPRVILIDPQARP